MKIGMVGLGRMGANMARRLMQGGHQCVAFDLNAESVRQLSGQGAEAASSLEDLAGKLHTVTELFPWIIGLLAGVLAIESLQAWRFGRRRGGGVAA